VAACAGFPHLDLSKLKSRLCLVAAHYSSIACTAAWPPSAPPGCPHHGPAALIATHLLPCLTIAQPPPRPPGRPLQGSTVTRPLLGQARGLLYNAAGSARQDTTVATYCLGSVREEATVAMAETSIAAPTAGGEATAARQPCPRPPLPAPFFLCSWAEALRYLCTSSFSP
jgi:hypothetical protein